MLYNFVLDKPPGYKVFCQPETIYSKKFNKSVLITTTFYLEDNDHNGETLTFTLQLVKV